MQINALELVANTMSAANERKSLGLTIDIAIDPGVNRRNIINIIDSKSRSVLGAIIPNFEDLPNVGLNYVYYDEEVDQEVVLRHNKLFETLHWDELIPDLAK